MVPLPEGRLRRGECSPVDRRFSIWPVEQGRNVIDSIYSRCVPLALAATIGFALTGMLSGCNLATPAMNADGVRMHQQGNYQGALTRFMQAVARNPDDADSYYNLAATYHQMGRVQKNQADFEQAESLYNQCLDRDPNHVDCYRGLAVLLSDTGRSDAASRLIEGWSVRNPSSADPKIEMARLMEETGDADQAIARLEEALSIEPDNSRALTALGRLREADGDTVQALANYQRSLARNRMQPDVARRVAALQAAVGGASGRFAPAESTRLVRNTVPTARY